MQYLETKKYGIFGLGLTGQSVYQYLNPNENIICWDDDENTRQNFAKKYSKCNLVPITAVQWLQLDEIVIAPGVPHSHMIFAVAKDYNIKITSDTEIFLSVHKQKSIIAITGTNGKSTTTALIYHLLKSCRLDYVMGGNIGIPLLDLPNAQGYILELSSFQLDLLQEMPFTISVLLNLTPDHLDRYNNCTDYYQSKLRIFQNNSLKIIGIDSADSAEYYYTNKDNIDFVAISSQDVDQKEKYVICTRSEIIDNYFSKQNYPLPSMPNLIGVHNQLNIAAAFAVCKALDIDSKLVINYLPQFKPLEHRMEYLGVKNGIKYYNDSKATNVSACICALSSFSNIYWLAGGIFKEKNLYELDIYLKNVRIAYLFGQDSNIFAEYLSNKIEYKIFNNMTEAFVQAKIDAETDKLEDAIILLSPACSSFDQFKNFQDRGNNFKKLYDEK
ncbi:MAG: UDP-N-acetylmuramoyl-L-alanine--D-glutamate ligase [Rickettsiaceae bacterium]|nr:UDP-N-acetylmuramoyl-L-alanine--D-glutamate ligase [Rickettsiaceae bacterium]